MADKIRWGIVGPGRIAHSFAKDLSLVEGGKLTAVASRNLQRAQEFANEYGAEYSFGSYEELFDSDVVDVLYIATPHTSHCELSIAAMEKGKNVRTGRPYMARSIRRNLRQSQDCIAALFRQSTARLDTDIGNCGIEGTDSGTRSPKVSANYLFVCALF